MLLRLRVPTFKLISLLMSALLVLPSVALAKPTPQPGLPASANQELSNDQVPVWTTEVVTPEGRKGVVRLSVETPAQEAKLVPYLATHEPNFHLIAAAKTNSRGEHLEDPLLGLVSRVTSFSNIHLSLAESIEKLPFLRSPSIPADWRQRVSAQFAGFSNRLQNSKAGVTVSLAIAGTQGTFTYHMSSELPPAMIVALASTALNGYQVIYADKWDKFMEMGASGVVKGGEFINRTMAKVMGTQARELTELEKRTLETTGRWATSMVLNTISTTFVFYFANELESTGQVLNFANLSTNDTLDSITNERLRLGIITERTARWLTFIRPMLSAAGDIAGYTHVPGAIPTLAVVMGGTFFYSIFGRELETKVFMPAIRKTKSLVKSIADRTKRKAASCGELLKRFSAPRVAQTE